TDTRSGAPYCRPSLACTAKRWRLLPEEVVAVAATAFTSETGAEGPDVCAQRNASVSVELGSVVAEAERLTAPGAPTIGPLPFAGAGRFVSSGRTRTATRSTVAAVPPTLISKARS